MQLYPASRGYIFAVWAVVRKLFARQLTQRKFSLCSQGNATPASCWNAILLLIRLFEKYS